jgi:hypothetical protein
MYLCLEKPDHGKLKRLVKPTLGFKSMKTAFATIKGFEIMRMFKKGQFTLWTYGQGLKGEVRLIESQFGIYSMAYFHRNQPEFYCSIFFATEPDRPRRPM